MHDDVNIDLHLPLLIRIDIWWLDAFGKCGRKLWKIVSFINKLEVPGDEASSTVHRTILKSKLSVPKTVEIIASCKKL